MPELRLPIRTHGVLLKMIVRHPYNGKVHELPVTAFLDTGASDSMIDLGVIESLGLEPCHQVGLNILGRNDTGYYNTYEVDISLQDTPLRWLPFVVLGGPCFQTGAAAALGRDFLRHFCLTYDGRAGKAVLSW